MIYVGAGTSGRLGVSGCCRVPPDVLHRRPTAWSVIIAGGTDGALTRSVEGAEDEPAAGRARPGRARRCAERDVVVGIAEQRPDAVRVGGDRSGGGRSVRSPWA